MSVGLYDIAVKNKIVKWILDPELTILDPDETSRLYQYRADISGDKPLKLPLIALSRARDIEILATNKKPMAYMGKTFNSNYSVSDNLNAIPISIEYQIDIYTKFKHQADEYVRNFVFNLVRHPKIELDIPYNESDLKYISYMSLLSPISDNSDIPERLIPGQFTRMTLRIKLPDAYLFSYDYKDIPKITGMDMSIGVNTDNKTNMDKDTESTIHINLEKGNCKCQK